MTDSNASRLPKLIIYAGIGLVALAALGTFLIGRARAPSIDDVLALIPTDANGLIVVRGLPALAVQFGALPNSLLSAELRDVMPGDVVETIELFEKQLEVDLHSVQGLLALGLDPTRPAAASSAVLRGDFVGVVFLPASNEATLVDNLNKWVDAQELRRDKITVGKTDIHYLSERGNLAWVAHEDMVIVAISDAKKVCRRLLEDTVEGHETGVADLPWVKAARPLIDQPWQVFGALNPALPKEVMRNLFRELPRGVRRSIDQDVLKKALSDVESFAGAVDISPKAVRVKFHSSVEEGAAVDPSGALGDRSDSLGSRIPGTALAAGRVALDLGKLREVLSSQDEIEEEVDDAMREFRRETGIDVQDDLLDFLGSPISFAVFESERAERIPLGAAAWVPLKKNHKLDRTLKDFVDTLNSERVPVDTDSVGDSVWYSVDAGRNGPSVAWGIARDHLVVVAGAKLETSLARAMDSADGSYLDSVGDAKAALTETGDAAMYVNVQEVIRSLEEQFDQDRELREAAPLLRKLDTVLFTAVNSGRASETVLEIRSLAGFEKDIAEAYAEERQRAARGKARYAALSQLDGIRIAEKAYHAEWDHFTAAPATPAAVPMGPVGFEGPGKRAFELLGWSPEGPSACQFSVELKPSQHRWKEDFLATAVCDFDGDGEAATYTASRQIRAFLVSESDAY